jgi:hypothetical protein
MKETVTTSLKTADRPLSHHHFPDFFSHHRKQQAHKTATTAGKDHP